ncbi:MAG TPA: PIG-L family deacetylase, partial [Armatimonadota bacterium]
APIPNYVVGPAAAHPPTAALVPLYYFGPLGGVNYFGQPVVAPWFIDISTVIDRKAEMLSRHASQREWLRIQHGVDQYIDEMRGWDAEAGHCIGVPYAEGFYQHRGHAYPQTPILQDALSELVREHKA